MRVVRVRVRVEAVEISECTTDREWKPVSISLFESEIRSKKTYTELVMFFALPTDFVIWVWFTNRVEW